MAKIRSTTLGDHGWKVRLVGETGNLGSFYGRRRNPRATLGLVRHDGSTVGQTDLSRRELRKLRDALNRILGEKPATVPGIIAAVREETDRMRKITGNAALSISQDTAILVRAARKIAGARA